MRQLICLFGMLLISSTAWGLTELTVQIGHQKQSYGPNHESDIVTKNYYWGTAFYFLQASTAVDVYYAHQTQIDNGRKLGLPTQGSDTIIDSTLTRVKSQSYGIGIKQAFTEEGSLIRPTLSIGHARQVIQSYKRITLRNGTGTAHEYSMRPKKQRYSSIFTTFAIQIRIIKGMSFQTSVQTIFQAFKLDQFENNLKYLVGLTWFL